MSGIGVDTRAVHYAEGLAEGFRITLRLFLGEPCAGSAPFTGPRTPESEQWARDSLARGETVSSRDAAITATRAVRGG